MPPPTDGIILLSKQSGITSFSSLWQIKNALGTKKIGHTGTLDTFAEGLLVVLAGRLTRLCSYVTDCGKEYEALVVFGTETDTLDPDGTVISESPLPALQSVLDSLSAFRGDILQRPPLYSAVHVSGQRASDRMRKGEAVELPLRPVTIYSLEAVSIFAADNTDAQSGSPVARMILRISCSKGTYIRSLARDIARACGSCAHLGALRRTRIGPFALADAAGHSMLSPFGTEAPAKYGVGDRPPQTPASEIVASVRNFDPSLADAIGLDPVVLDGGRLDDFMNGKKLLPSWFTRDQASCKNGRKSAVFCAGLFVGAVSFRGDNPVYEFVTGREP